MPYKAETMSGLKSLDDIEDVISKAIKKVGGRKENDLCKYLPMSTGGYMHHFTLRKMKLKQPFELSTLIEKFIITSNKPTIISPKQRAARGSRKRKDQITFTKTQLDRLLNMAKISGDREMVSVLSPKKSLANCKKELIQSIRAGIADQVLWNTFTEITASQNDAEAALEQLFNR